MSVISRVLSAALALAAAGAETAADRSEHVRALLDEAKRLERSDPRASLAKLDETLLWLEPSGDSRLRFEVLGQKCWLLAVEEPAESLRLVAAELEGTDASARLDSPVGLAELRLCRGYARERRGEIEEAAADYERAVADGERFSEQASLQLEGGKLLASAAVLRGELRYYRGNLTGALEDLERAWRLELELGRAAQQNYALNAIANLYADARVANFERALEHYRTLLGIYQAAGDLRLVATARFNLGSTLERKGDLEAALAEYERALEIDLGRQDPGEVAADQRALGALLVKLGRAREALAPLDAALEQFLSTGAEEDAARARLSRGIARHAMRDLEGALEDLDAARARFATGNDRFLERVEGERAEVLAAASDWAGAFRARSSQLELERRLAESVRDEHTSRLRVEFDTERRERENQALARENELQRQAVRDAERIRRLQRIALFLAAGLLVALALLGARLLVSARAFRRLALTDELTRLPNRRFLLRQAAERFAEARSTGAPLALAALDIDHFKRINDTLGHEAGDHVLERVAHACRGALRTGDTIGRTGGEEFTVLLPGAGREIALEVGERLRAAVERIDAGDLATDLRVTASIGVAVVTTDDCDLAALARRADEALYAAKQGGRNRVEEGAPGTVEPKTR